MNILGVELDELQADRIGSWPLLARHVVFFVTFIVSLFIGYFFQLGDTLVALDAADKRVVTLSATYLDTYRRVSTLDLYRKAIADIKRESDVLIALLPATKEEAGVLEDLSQEALKNNLEVISVRPGKQMNKGFYYTLPIELTMTGNYINMGEFASDIANNISRVVTLHDFTLSTTNSTNSLMGGAGQTSGGGNLESSSNLTMVFTAKTYWAPQGMNK